VAVIVVALAAAVEAAELETLVVETKDGPVEFDVEYAGTPDEYARGLMFRDHLDAGTGMIFDFHQPRRASFWMRNTLISLDIIFIDEDGIIRFIAPRMKPLSEKSVGPKEPVLGVLEINGGEAEELGIEVGDRVRHRTFE
jgi:uncharacterized membrane protein (UPF0127 family)